MIQAQAKLSPTVLWLMSIISAVVVANNYYNQPLLAEIAMVFQVSEGEVSRITVLTQLGYAFGLLMIIPLGDKFPRKRLILIDLLFVLAALIWMALAQSFWMLFVASFLIGCSSVIPQLFIPMAADLSSPKNRSKNLGLIMSGLLLGILLSRFVGGIVGDLWGWRSIYWIAAGLMVCSWLAIYRLFPEIKPNFKGNYLSLMQSVWQLAKSQPVLQLAAFRGAMGFAALCTIFTTLVFHLEQPPFEVGPTVAGSFGLVGAAGALAAAFVGQLTRRLSVQRIISLSLAIILLSWIFTYFGGETYLGLIIGIILIDLGLQSSHIMNQSDYFSIKTTATSRLNTVYMVSYFIGGSFGSWSAAEAWEYGGWPAVCAVGFLYSLLALLAHLLFAKKLGTAKEKAASGAA